MADLWINFLPIFDILYPFILICPILQLLIIVLILFNWLNINILFERPLVQRFF